MASEGNQHFHFALFPFLAQGHMIPMLDIAKMLARRGLKVTIFTTHKNADRFEASLDRAVESGLRIGLVKLCFPSAEVGLPEGCENLDMLPDQGMVKNFFSGVGMLHHPAEEAFERLEPRPCCIISDMCFPWTLDIANKFRVPRVTFSGFCSFFLACLGKIRDSNVLDALESDTQAFAVPELPDDIEFTKDQISMVYDARNETEILGQITRADKASYGSIVNSFEELEPSYAEVYKKSKGGKVWLIGLVSLYNENELDKAQRGNIKADLDKHKCFQWLDSCQQGTVVYACMGSLCNLTPTQMMELGFGLEASVKPFIWVIRGKNVEQMDKYIKEDGFEERVKGRGLLIRGWAPQVLILSHPAIGVFLTHCGWNSTIEGICAGLALITWPLFGDQFGNQKLIEKVLRIGVSVGVGADVCMKWGEEERLGILVKRAIERVMNCGEEMRKKAKEFGELAKRAVEGGSSHHNLSMLIEDIKKQVVKDHL